MISIIKKEVKPENLRFYLEFTLSESIDNLWIECYNKALFSVGTITTVFGTGAPTVDKVKFNYNKATTKSFPEYAKIDLKQFISEFESVVDVANRLYESEKTIIKQQQEMKLKQQEENQKELNSLNDFINND